MLSSRHTPWVSQPPVAQGKQIHPLFTTVRKKHAEMVPQKLKEEQFWTQFFQSQYFHQDSKNEQFVDCLSGGQRQGNADWFQTGFGLGYPGGPSKQV